MPAVRTDDVDAIRVGSRAHILERELQRHRRELAGELKLIGAGSGVCRIWRADRLLGGDRADTGAGGIIPWHRVDEPQPERTLCDEPGFIAFETVLGELRRSSGPRP